MRYSNKIVKKTKLSCSKDKIHKREKQTVMRFLYSTDKLNGKNFTVDRSYKLRTKTMVY